MPYVTTLRIIRRDRPPCRASIFELERQRNLRPFDTPHRYPLLTLVLHVTVEAIVTTDGLAVEVEGVNSFVHDSVQLSGKTVYFIAVFNRKCMDRTNDIREG